ncbi:sushi domain-containing protein 2 [Chanos chanos]|uniref:Sushi domain-containing protein 2 n=1 Tax=Chanos chanos TaxID=29144 RepID=A0A6J2WT12_CHACN|nr:sushi domain-containing protein 2-like [Chanos chanos]
MGVHARQYEINKRSVQQIQLFVTMGSESGDRLLFAITFIVLFQLFFTTNAQTCAGNCGKKLDSCSCHATCQSLRECCPDFKQFCVEITPHSGSLLGGTDFLVLDSVFNPNDKIICRFNGETETEGYVDGDGRGHCISPLLYESGWIPFDISTDGVNFKASGRWLSVHHSKLDSAFKIVLKNATQWQYYGTPGTTGTLEMTWNASLIKADRVNVELWGYEETGEPYSSNWAPEWRYLYTLGKDVPNSGSFSFVPVSAKKPYSDWHMGSMRVSPSTKPDGQMGVNALWSGAHALAWHLEEEFRKDPAGWALDKCVEWDALEKSMPNFLEEIADCPCTLAQARADTGRFHTDYGCDIEKGSKCTYHPGSVHCVRAIQASPKYAAGQQCCYDKAGAQVLTGDSIGGSTPDRGHDWGSPPYKKPPRVPGLSHWKYDVITFYYCCLWSDNCHYYFTHRPSSDCRTYTPPKAGVVLGDPHFVTFDGASYTFNGKGEYILTHSPDYNLTIQGRTEPMNGTALKATRLTSVAMREAASDVVEVRLIDGADQLEVLVNQRVLSFSEQSWIDLKGVFVYSSISKNATVMFPSGAGVEVRAGPGTLATTVLLPREFRDKTRGLLGRMNENPDDDLTSSSGEVIGATENKPEDVFRFGASWAIANETSLFTYDSEYLLKEYYFGPKHDPAFVPAFSVTEDSGDPLLEQTLKMCFGKGSQFCKYDALVTRNLEMGNATLRSFQSHQSVIKDLEPVLSCGWLPPPSHGQKEGQLYLEGAKVTFSCNHGYRLYGSAERTCLDTGKWSGETASCVSDNTLAIVLGSVGAILTLVVMAIAIALYTRKQKRERSKNADAKADSERSSIPVQNL